MNTGFGQFGRPNMGAWVTYGKYWEVFVFWTPVKLVGGGVDSEIVYPLFSLDLQGLSSCFEKVEDFRWQAHAFSPHDPEGRNVCIEGIAFASDSSANRRRTKSPDWSLKDHPRWSRHSRQRPWRASANVRRPRPCRTREDVWSASSPRN